MNHKGTVRLETERLILRQFTVEDAEAEYQNWASDPEVTKYLTWPAYSSVDAAHAYMNYCINLYNEPAGYQWGIELKDTHELIGNISVVGVREDINELELGWVIGRNWWGQGIMPEAASYVIQFLFEEVGANRIYAGHDIANQKSGRVMQKVGMQYEGTMRAAGKNNQGIVDMAIYAILKEDYVKKK